MKASTPNTLRVFAALAGAMIVAPTTEGSLEFVAMLPNGGNVPDTPAIGHPDGTGDSAATNTFGDAFSEAGNKWTKELCEADTDGDGQTNGQELGDPCCEWDMDANPVVLWTDGVSHPDDASKTSDESLWASVVCGSAFSSASKTTEAVEGSLSSAGNSTASSSTAGSKASSSSPTSTPSSSSQSSSTSSTSSAPAPAHALFIAAAGVFTVVVMNFA